MVGRSDVDDEGTISRSCLMGERILSLLNKLRSEIEQENST